MPTDRSNTSNTGRPLKPTLATTRTAKTPLAPRLAPSLVSTSSSQSSRTLRSTPSSTPRVQTAQEDRTPGGSLLNVNNVTPRSTKRLSRVGVSSPGSTPSVTPSSTPTGARPSSTIEVPGNGYNVPRINTMQSAQSTPRPRSTVGGSQVSSTPSYRPPLASGYSGSATSDVGDTRGSSSKFFHANDARPQELTPAPLQPKKGPVFFHANGQQDANTRSSELPSPPLSALGKSPVDSKFFHVDSLSELKGSSPVLSPSPASPFLEPWAVGNPTQKPPTLRSNSPTKENIHLSHRNGASQVIRPSLRSRPSNVSNVSGVSAQSLESEASQHIPRRKSSALGHGKSASLSSIDSVTQFKKSQNNNPPTIIPSPLHNEKRVFSNLSLPDSVASAPGSATETSSNPQSPARSTVGKSALDHMNELAANARRERKVLDLEISNSSLLAINRQLEKEVRKQKAELRRFRRMTRAGRFSSDAVSSFPEHFSAVGASEVGELSDMSEHEQELAEEEQECSSESSFDEGTMSPTALAERDEAHRLRDEKRLQLDLSKHRELLIDSQKMNESLKRCLNWTEELIKDGQKALAYQVKPSDVRLGGRVLSTEEHSEMDHDEESKGLLSPWSPTHRARDIQERLSLAESGRTDRDSGVDVDALNLSTTEHYDYMSPLGSPLNATPPQQSRKSEALEAY